MYIYTYQGWAMSVRVVLTCGVPCCHLPCRAVLDGLAWSACRVGRAGSLVGRVGPYPPRVLVLWAALTYDEPI